MIKKIQALALMHKNALTAAFLSVSASSTKAFGSNAKKYD